MQTEWISTDKNNHLIIYFAGWGTSPELVKHWSIPIGYDLLLCWDYRTLQLDFDFNRYQQFHLVAWSMGVWAAEQCVAHLNFKTSVAINGTPPLIHDQQGIPIAVFKGTLEGFNDITRNKFERRMCGNNILLQQYQAVPRRATSEIKQELISVDLALTNAKPATIAWQKAIIGTQDHIFPSANQLNYWQQSTAQIEQISAPHFLFPMLNDWSTLCD